MRTVIRAESAPAIRPNPIRTGVIHNPRSRWNRRGGPRPTRDGVLEAAPATREALDEALARFAAEGLDLLVIDGGDGTVREVLTRAPSHFRQGLPRLAVLPSGKTNALALDLGAPMGWTLEAAMEAAGRGRVTHRAPLEVTRLGAEAPLVRGFIFGAGVYVRATELAQRTHRLGAFNSLAVALTLAAAAVQTLAAGPGSHWRAGVPMRLQCGDAPAEPKPVFLLLASSLERLPLDVKPFGPPGPGLKTLTVEAPPRRLLRALPPLLAGDEPAWLEAAGYRRGVAGAFDVQLDSRFVLDGESFAGGQLRVAEGAPLAFGAP